MKNLMTNYLFSLSYQIVTLIIPFVTIPYLTRVLGTGPLGIEAYTLTILNIFIAIATLGTVNFAVRELASQRHNRDKFNDLAKQIFLFRFYLAVVSFLIYTMFIFQFEYAYELTILSLYLIGSTFFDTIWYYMASERFKEITMRNIIVKVMGFIATILFVNSHEDLWKLLLINGLVILIPNIYFSFKFAKETNLKLSDFIKRRSYKKLITSMIPFMLIGVISQLYIGVEKIILELSNLTNDLGAYSQIVKTINVILAPITAVGTIMLPFMSKSASEGTNEAGSAFKMASNVIILIGTPMFFGALSTADVFVPLYFGVDFEKYTVLFKLSCFLIITGCISNIIIQQVIFPKKKEIIYIYALVGGLIIKFLITLSLVSFLGVYAAMLGFILSEILILFICFYKTKQLNIHFILFNKNNLKILFSGLFMYSLISTVGENLIFKIIIGIVSYSLMILLLKEETFKAIKKSKVG